MRTVPALAITMLVMSLAAPLAVAVDLTNEAQPRDSSTTWVRASPYDDEHSYPLGDPTYDVPPGHSTLIVSAEDLLSGSSVGLRVCWLSPDGDDICDEDDVVGEGCGPLALGAPFSGGTAKATVPTLWVSADLDLCIATTGKVTFSSW